MKKNTVWILLAAIMLLSIVLRVYKFTQIPMGLNRDEMALGYNAYSLLKTGKDEWGKQWPVVFRSFGDYKLGGYIYTLMPFVSLFGLSPQAVRLPSLLAGIALPLAVYLFVVAYTKKKTLGLLSASMVAVSPWAIFYSRIGFEANLALVMFVLGLAFFVVSFRSWKILAVSLACFFAAFLTYSSPILLIPPLAIVLWVMYGKQAKKSVLTLVAATIIAFVVLFPSIQGKGTVTVFSDPSLHTQANELYLKAGNNPVVRILAKPIIFTTIEIGKRYIATFSPVFLVTKGGTNPWLQSNGGGHLTWSLYILAAVGIVIALMHRGKDDITMLAILLLSPIPSAITIDAPHATRSLMFFVMLTIFASRAIFTAWEKKKIFGILVLCIVLIDASIRFKNDVHGLLVPPQPQWNVELQAAVREAEQHRGNGTKTIVVVGDIHYAYIEPLFYTALSPDVYRSTVQYQHDDAIGLSQVKSFGHYLFIEDRKNVPPQSIIIDQDEETGLYGVHENG